MVEAIYVGLKKRKGVFQKNISRIIYICAFCFVLFVISRVAPIPPEIMGAAIAFGKYYISLCIVFIIVNVENDNAAFSIFYLAWAIYFLNWFFDDIKKALSFPLALLFYLWARVHMPKEVVKLFRIADSYLIFKNHENQAVENYEQQKVSKSGKTFEPIHKINRSAQKNRTKNHKLFVMQNKAKAKKHKDKPQSQTQFH